MQYPKVDKTFYSKTRQDQDQEEKDVATSSDFDREKLPYKVDHSYTQCMNKKRQTGRENGWKENVQQQQEWMSL